MRFSTHAFLTCVTLAAAAVIAFPGKTVPTNNARQTTTVGITAAPSCGPSCNYSPPFFTQWTWSTVSATETITYATVVTIINTRKNTTRYVTSTVNLPTNHTLPRMDDAGTVVCPVTFWDDMTSLLTYLNVLGEYDATYAWTGQLATTKANEPGPTSCVTDGGQATLKSHPDFNEWWSSYSSITMPTMTGDSIYANPQGINWVCAMESVDNSARMAFLSTKFPDEAAWEECSLYIQAPVLSLPTAAFVTATSISYEGDDDVTTAVGMAHLEEHVELRREASVTLDQQTPTEDKTEASMMADQPASIEGNTGTVYTLPLMTTEQSTPSEGNDDASVTASQPTPTEVSKTANQPTPTEAKTETAQTDASVATDQSTPTESIAETAHIEISVATGQSTPTSTAQLAHTEVPVTTDQPTPVVDKSSESTPTSTAQLVHTEILVSTDEPPPGDGKSSKSTLTLVAHTESTLAALDQPKSTEGIIPGVTSTAHTEQKSSPASSETVPEVYYTAHTEQKVTSASAENSLENAHIESTRLTPDLPIPSTAHTESGLVTPYGITSTAHTESESVTPDYATETVHIEDTELGATTTAHIENPTASDDEIPVAPLNPSYTPTSTGNVTYSTAWAQHVEKSMTPDQPTPTENPTPAEVQVASTAHIETPTTTDQPTPITVQFTTSAAHIESPTTPDQPSSIQAVAHVESPTATDQPSQTTLASAHTEARIANPTAPDQSVEAHVESPTPPDQPTPTLEPHSENPTAPNQPTSTEVIDDNAVTVYDATPIAVTEPEQPPQTTDSLNVVGTVLEQGKGVAGGIETPQASVQNIPVGSSSIALAPTAIATVISGTTTSIPAVVVGSKTLIAGQTVVIDNTPISIPTATPPPNHEQAQENKQPPAVVVGGSSTVLVSPAAATPSPAPPPLTIAGHTIQPSGSLYIISGQTVAPGSPITLGSASSATVVALTTNAAGSAIAVLGTQTIPYTPAPVVTTPAPLAPLTLLPDTTISPSGPASAYLIAGHTLLPNSSPLTLAPGTTLALITNPQGQTLAILNSATTQTLAPPTTTPPLTLFNALLTPLAPSTYLYASHTLAPGTTLTLAPDRTLALTTDAAGHHLAILNSATASSTPILLFGAPLTASGSAYLYAGHTIFPGKTLTLAPDRTLALTTNAAGQNVAILNDATTTTLPPAFPTGDILNFATTAPPLVLYNTTLTPLPGGGGYVYAGQTLSMGASVTVSGGKVLGVTTDGVGRTVVVEGGKTGTGTVEAGPTRTGLGGFIQSGLGGEEFSGAAVGGKAKKGVVAVAVVMVGVVGVGLG